MNTDAIRAALVEAGLDGWLFQDFRGSDPIARSVLGLHETQIQSRRWFYWFPANGEPVKLVHAIESNVLDELPGTKRIYLPWSQLHSSLAEILDGARRIAMQYSPNNAIPHISRVDAGTVELIRSFGVEVVSSADLVQRFEATLDDEQIASHRFAADRLGELVKDAFREIASRLDAGVATTECDIQRFLLTGFDEHGLVTDHPPIVAVDAHSADPHYFPTEDACAVIEAGSFVLIDLWAKREAPRSIFGDLTWTGYVGATIPEEHQRIFGIVRDARDAAIAAVCDAYSAGRPVRGCDVDDVCRGVITDAGYGDRFIHRTGHSIHTVGHGNGANLDNLETRDERCLIPRTCFSVEPGIYLPGQFGIRSEVDMLVSDEQTVAVTGPEPQRDLVRIV